MRSVASGLGVTATSLYRHFATKEDLVEAIVDNGFVRLASYLRRARSVPGVMERFVDFALDEPRLYELMFHRRRAAVRRFPADFAEHKSATFDQLRAKVDAGMANGSLAPGDSLEVTLTIWAHAHGLVSMYTLGRFGTDSRRFRAIYRRSMRRLYEGIAVRTARRRS
jgi:AcrR family transcriptional regulator